MEIRYDTESQESDLLEPIQYDWRIFLMIEGSSASETCFIIQKTIR
jgi:hypothetical protein